jgi:signal transduction histidine kinase
MKPRSDSPCASAVIAADGLDLAEVSRLAMSELRADALLVQREAGSDAQFAFLEGPAAAELASMVRLGTGSGRTERLATGAASAAGGGWALSASLTTGTDRDIGSVHVLYREAPADPGRYGELLEAFARHMAIILGRDGAQHGPGQPSPDRDAVLTVDDLPLLPDAVKAITGRVAEMMQPLTGATAVGITVWDEERRILTALPGAFGATDEVVAASVTGPVTNLRSASSRVLTTGQPYLTNCASGDPGILQPYVEIFEISRILSVPLNNGSRRIGVLHLVNKPTDFTTDDITAAERVTPRIAIAVELAISVARMSAQQRLEGVLTSVAVAIASGQSVEDGLLPAFDRLAAVTAASLVALIPPDSPPLVCRRGASDPELEQRVIGDGRTLGSRSRGEFPRVAGEPGWAALHVPVELHGRRTATLAILRRNSEPFTAAEEDVVSRLASLVALAWATEQYQRQLAQITRLQERERIADELHDRVAQIMFTAQLGLDTMLERPEVTAQDRQRLTEVRDLLASGDIAIRDVIHDLARVPGSHLGRRLRLEVQAVEEEFAVVVHTEIPDDGQLAPIPRTVADALVKVAREGTVNAAKHAGPCRIALTVQVDAGQVSLSVLDDGMGGHGESRAGEQDVVRGHGIAALRRIVEDAGGSIGTERSQTGFGTRLVCCFCL